LADWLELEVTDPNSRFHRLRIATPGTGAHGLRSVLTSLRDQNRRNVLIVPAEFYAGEAAMRELEKQVRELEDHMTIHWLPGLGGQETGLSSTP
jgi:hypothetical protein